MNEDMDKTIKIMPEVHKLLYRRWKDKGVSIRAQIKELVDNSRKYNECREVRNA